MNLSRTPFWLKWLYPSLIWHQNRAEKNIFLTFDDGPIPVVTPFVIKTLERFHAKATFFCIGDNVKKHPDIYDQLLAKGHGVGNHTYNHLRGWDHPSSLYLENIRKCADLVGNTWFRPPYGRIKWKQIREIRKVFPETQIIMWDVLSMDYDTNLNSDQCVKNVLDNAENGSIIVFHDSEKAFPRLEDALPRVLEDLKNRGFEFKVLP